MGLIARIFGTSQAIATLGQTARGVAEVFTPNATRSMELATELRQSALAQHGAEFTHAPDGWFDAMVNGLNRLPRPMLALGTLALFGYAMADPSGFSLRMQGLGTIPEPLWWLLGAVVAFYFGARETHYLRARMQTQVVPADSSGQKAEDIPPEDNPALQDWRNRG
jgi:hypothetical protein